MVNNNLYVYDFLDQVIKESTCTVIKRNELAFEKNNAKFDKAA